MNSDEIDSIVKEFEAQFNHSTLCNEVEEGCTCLAQDFLRKALTQTYQAGYEKGKQDGIDEFVDG